VIASLIRRPGAFLPLIMSLAALAMVIGHAAMYGVVREPDEGTPAHIFQLLMVAQVPLMVFFAMTWLPRFPWPAIQILGLQLLAGIAAITAVVFLT